MQIGWTPSCNNRSAGYIYIIPYKAVYHQIKTLALSTSLPPVKAIATFLFDNVLLPPNGKKLLDQFLYK